MHPIIPLLATASLASASATQQPLIKSETQSLISDYDSKPLVSSAALEARIKADNLFGRAKDLYRIAEKGVDEYNHPTRVIGSKGRSLSQSPTFGCLPLLTLMWYRTPCNDRLHLLHHRRPR